MTMTVWAANFHRRTFQQSGIPVIRMAGIEKGDILSGKRNGHDPTADSIGLYMAA
jgi:hypothetical protein